MRVVCVGGGQADVDAYPATTLLGGPLRGYQRVKSLWRLWKFSRSVDSNVILLAGAWVALPWLLVAGRANRNSLVWEHSLLQARFDVAPRLKLLHALARFLYRRARRVVVVSEALHVDLTAMCPTTEVVTIPNLVEMNGHNGAGTRCRTIDPTTIALLNVGSLTRLKAQHILLEAFAHLDDRFVLTIAGSGKELAALKSQAEQLGVDSRVIFTGFVTKNEVRTLMAESDLMVHTAVAETFGMVFVEAAEAGLPVVAVRSAVAEEMIPKYVPGWVCAAAPEEIALDIRKRLEEQISVQELDIAGQRRKQRFGADAVLRKWHTAFKL